VTSIPITRLPHDSAEMPDRPARPHLAVQILGLLLFGGFAIVATSLAFVFFWPAGFVLAIVLGWIGFGRILNQRHAGPRREDHRMSAPSLARTGNASFDTYRTEVLDRLQDEQRSFVRFLDRLRDAKDKAQFDRFMDDRARTTHHAEGGGETGHEARGGGSIP
jgi:Protein of unknown function (DUF2852)